MWKQFKNYLFNAIVIGIFLALLVCFIIIQVTGKVYFGEPNSVILWIEITMCIGMLIWSIKRTIRDWRNSK